MQANNKVTVEIYFKTGLSPEFYRALEGFCLKLYNRYSVNSDFEDYFDLCKEEIDTKVYRYDPTKANFKTYLYSIMRNVSTKVKNRNKRLIRDDPNEDRPSLFDMIPSRIVNSCDEQGSCLEVYLIRMKQLGYELNELKLLENLETGRKTPLIMSYLWLFHRRKLNDAEL